MENAEAQVLKLSNKITTEKLSDFNYSIATALDSGVKNIVLDLGELDFLDSAFIGVLVKTLDKVRNSGGLLKLQNLKKQALDIMKLSSLNEVFGISEDELEQKKPEISFTIDGSTGIIELFGIVDTLEITRDFRNCYTDKMKDVRNIIINFKEAKFVGSSLIGEIINIHQNMKSKNGILTLCAMNSVIYEIFEKLGLGLLIERYSSLDEAIKDMEKNDD